MKKIQTDRINFRKWIFMPTSFGWGSGREQIGERPISIVEALVMSKWPD
jgi:hypothetical protein